MKKITSVSHLSDKINRQIIIWITLIGVLYGIFIHVFFHYLLTPMFGLG